MKSKSYRSRTTNRWAGWDNLDNFYKGYKGTTLGQGWYHVAESTLGPSHFYVYQGSSINNLSKTLFFTAEQAFNCLSYNFPNDGLMAFIEYCKDNGINYQAALVDEEAINALWDKLKIELRSLEAGD